MISSRVKYSLNKCKHVFLTVLAFYLISSGSFSKICFHSQFTQYMLIWT